MDWRLFAGRLDLVRVWAGPGSRPLGKFCIRARAGITSLPRFRDSRIQCARANISFGPHPRRGWDAAKP